MMSDLVREGLKVYVEDVVSHWETCEYVTVAQRLHWPAGCRSHYDPYVHCPAYAGYVICEQERSQEPCSVLEHERGPYAIEAHVRESKLWPGMKNASLRVVRDELTITREALYHFGTCPDVRTSGVDFCDARGVRMTCRDYIIYCFTHVKEVRDSHLSWCKPSCFLRTIDAPLARALLASGVISVHAPEPNWARIALIYSYSTQTR